LKHGWVIDWMVCQMDVDYRFEKGHLEHSFRDVVFQRLKILS
jgi:hypothetical protein